MAYLDKSHPRLSHIRQCGLLSVNRSSTYYESKATPQADVDLLNQSLGYKTPEEVYNGLLLGKSRPDGYVDRSLDLGIERPTYPQVLCVNQKRGSQIFLK